MANLPKIAVQRLHQQRAAGTHPDLNLVSAFAENSLTGESRDQIVQHLAHCADCREVVFLASPDQAATLPATPSYPSTWLTWPVLRWGAAVAAVVVVVAAVSLHRQPGTSAAPSGGFQQIDAPVAKERADSAPAEQKREMAAAAKIASVPQSAPSPIHPVETNGAMTAVENRAGQFKKQETGVVASPMLAQESAGVGGKLADERKNERDKAESLAVSGQALTPAESETADANQVVPGRAKDASDSASKISGGAAALAPGAPATARSRAALFAPAITPRWTLTSEGTLQRSLDLGRTWQTILVTTQNSFRALAANGSDIWVGGSKGGLFHSSDAGQNWTQVHPVAASQALGDDIIGVEFPDSLHGKLTTSGKEIWTTEDGGQSWRKP